MNAEQYRALVNKLEALQEAPDDAAIAAAQSASNTAPVPTDGTTAPATTAPATTAPAADPNQIPTIEAGTFSQAYAQARKQGLKKFKWCGVYAVKDPVNPQPAVKKPEQKVDYTNQASPLGGTLSNPMSFAPNSNFGA